MEEQEHLGLDAFCVLFPNLDPQRTKLRKGELKVTKPPMMESVTDKLADWTMALDQSWDEDEGGALHEPQQGSGPPESPASAALKVSLPGGALGSFWEQWHPGCYAQHCELMSSCHSFSLQKWWVCMHVCVSSRLQTSLNFLIFMHNTPYSKITFSQFLKSNWQYSKHLCGSHTCVEDWPQVYSFLPITHLVLSLVTASPSLII